MFENHNKVSTGIWKYVHILSIVEKIALKFQS